MTPKLSPLFADDLIKANLLSSVAAWEESGTISYVPDTPDAVKAAVEALALTHNPSREDLSTITSKIQTWMDNQAKKYGFDNIASAISYLNSSNANWKAQAIAFNDWRDSVWTTCYVNQAAVLNGTLAIPTTAAEVILLLPQPTGIIA